MSLRSAINAKCRDCIHDPLAAGSAAVQIETCTLVRCPLWPVRPVRHAPRSPYSAPVREELGWSEARAARVLADPRDPAAFAAQDAP